MKFVCKSNLPSGFIAGKEINSDNPQVRFAHLSQGKGMFPINFNKVFQ
jgi:hypothetical protein